MNAAPRRELGHDLAVLDALPQSPKRPSQIIRAIPAPCVTALITTGPTDSRDLTALTYSILARLDDLRTQFSWASKAGTGESFPGSGLDPAAAATDPHPGARESGDEHRLVENQGEGAQ